MPNFDANGNEEWVCQRGAHICTGESTWIPGEGNVCKNCLENEMTPEEKQKLEELYQESRRQRAEDGGIWPEFTGPGR